MARQRFVKPGFFKHRELYDAEVSSGLPLRIAYQGCWTVADRRGVFRIKGELKLDILPYDPVDLDQVITHLEAGGFIETYVVDGKRYGFIPTFKDHQTFHRDEKQSNDPGPEAAQGQHRANTVPAPCNLEVSRQQPLTKEHGADTVPARGQHADPTTITTAVTMTVDGAPPSLTDHNHRSAYSGFQRAAQNPDAVAAEIRSAAEGAPTGGIAFGWPVVGQALHEMSVAGARFSAQALRGFARKVRERRSDRPVPFRATNDVGKEQWAVKEPDGSLRFLSQDEYLRVAS